MRVSVFFWVAALVLGWRPGVVSDPSQLLIWAAAMFGSILLHELGHVLAFRRYGIASYILLYHFGGLAKQETGSFSSNFGGRQLDSRAQIVVSAAGPGIQLLLAFGVLATCRAAGASGWFEFDGKQFTAYLPFVHPDILWGAGSSHIASRYLNFLVVDLVRINILWAALNLLPIYPLDGGQIARELFLMNDSRSGIKNSLILSIATAVGVAILALMTRQSMMPIMFGMLAFMNYQMLQQYTGRGGGFGGGGFGGGGGGFGGGRGW